MKHAALMALAALVVLGALGGDALAAGTDPAAVAGPLADGEPKGPAGAMQLVIILALASLAPAIVLTCTSFVRFVVVFSFLRNGLGTQGAPPSQVMVGLALFMTMFVMAPTATAVYEVAGKPYLDGAMTEKEALDAATPTIRTFLLERTREKDLELFYEVSTEPRPAGPDDVPLKIAVPAYVLSELGTAFRMGLVILLPFLVIELVVAAILSALGMVMLPPPIVSLPIKLLVFVAVDGWHLVVQSLLRGVI